MKLTLETLKELRGLLDTAEMPATNFASISAKMVAHQRAVDAITPHLRELLDLADVGARLRANRDDWTDADTARFVERCMADLNAALAPEGTR